jgi:hypothetical protein
MKVSLGRSRIIALVVLLLIIGGGIGYWRMRSHGARYHGPCKHSDWSIGLYTGKDPLHVSPWAEVHNPVLVPSQVTDRPARALADPFLFRTHDLWYLFFEVISRGTEQGDIGYATSKDGKSWEYQKIVLDEEFHLSYPYVFEHEGQYYMIPETRAKKGIRLYRAESFPEKWHFERELIPGNYADSSIVNYEGKWWIFTCRVPYTLHGYYADTLLGPWHPHGDNPLHWYRKTMGRPGGRLVVSNGKLIRYAQDSEGGYGHQLRAFVVDKLTADEFEEHEAETSPILQPQGDGWRARAMHTLSAWQLPDTTWLAAVDGAGCPPERK